MTPVIDLTGEIVKVIGNQNDSHTFRLRNPGSEIIITPEAIFESDFESTLGKITSVTIDTSQQADGILMIPVVIDSGTLRVRRLSPQQTVLVLEIEVK